MIKKQYCLYFLLFILFFLGENKLLRAQVASWTFYNTATGVGTTGSEVELNATTIDPNLVTPVLTRGTNAVTGAGSARGFTGRFPITATYDEAILNDSYYQFTVTSKNGYYASLSTLDATLRPTGGSAKTYRWVYSLDGLNFVELGPGEVTIPGTDTNGYPQATIDLSGHTNLQNIPSGKTIIFRLYAWGGTVASGSFGFGKSTTAGTNAIVIGGLVTEKPLVLAWQFSGIATGGFPGSYNATLHHPGLETTAVARGTGLTASSLFYSYAATVAASITTKASAIANKAYFEFTAKPKPGFDVNLNSIAFKFRRSATGPAAYRWMYSLDNGISFIELGTADGTLTSTDTNGEVKPEVDFSANASLKNLTFLNPIIFRLYIWSITDLTSVFAIGRFTAGITTNSLVLNGTAISTILPIKLISFTGNRLGSSVKLNWETATETNNSHFELIRFAEGETKKVLTTVKAVGNSTTNSRYSYTDFNPYAQQSYYLLRQIDLDGKMETFSPVVIKSLAKKETFKIAKAPNGKLNLSTNSELAKQVKLVIIGVTGKIVHQQEITIPSGYNNLQIDVSLSPGVFIACLQEENGQTSHVKFIY